MAGMAGGSGEVDGKFAPKNGRGCLEDGT